MMLRRSTSLFVVAALTLLGFALRLYQINHVPLRGDEAFTVIHWVREPLADTLANIATIDPQAPLSYALYNLWGTLTGTGELTVRFLPALLNLIGVPVLYALGKQIGGRRFGYIAAFLWAIHPYQIWHAQDARNYAIWAALSPLAAWLALRALAYNRRIDWLLYVAAAALAGYIYYLELFALVVLNLFVFVTRWRERRLLLTWIAAQIAIGLIFAPWYLQERLLFSSGYGGTTGQLDPPLWLTWFIPTLTFGESLPAEVKSLLWIVLLIALVFGWYLLWQRQRKIALWLGLLGTLPLILLGIVSTRLNVFTPRYVLAAAPVYTLLLTALIVFLPLRSVSMRRMVSGTIIALTVAVSAFSLYNYYFVPSYYKSPDWRALATYLAQRVQPDDLVIQGAADEAFTFYAREYDVPGDLIYLPANPRQSAEEITAVLSAQTAAHRSTWYTVNPPPHWTNRMVALDWLNAAMQRVRQTSIPTVPIAQYMAWGHSTARESVPVIFSAASGSAVIELIGFEVWQEPDDQLTLWLYWHPLTSSAADYKVFVHLIGTQPQPATQDDQFLLDGLPLPADVVRDIYSLPLENVSAGEYRLMVGLYDPQTQARLTAQASDSVTLQTITLP